VLIVRQKKFKKVVKWKDASLWNRIIFIFTVFIVFPILVFNLWFDLLDSILLKIIYTIVLLITMFFSMTDERFETFGKRKVYWVEIK